MKRPIFFTTAMVGAGLLLAGCTAPAEHPVATITQQPVEPTSQAEPVVSDYDLAPSAVMAANNDYTTVNTDEWSEADAVEVSLSGSGLAASGASSLSGSGVTASGGVVTITQAGVYRLSGSLTGGILVDAPDDALVVLMLDGVQITNSSGPAIEVRNADDVALHLVDGSVNTVSDAATYSDDADADAAIFAATDLTISGEGSLSVTGNGGDGLKSNGDDDEASADIDWARGYIYVRGGEVVVTAGDDGLQAFTDTVIAAGTVTIDVADDGVKAEVIVSIGQEREEPTVVTVASSTEGIEAANIGIIGGTVSVTASDDGINASGNAELQALIAGEEFGGVTNREADTGERLEISGGTIAVNALFDGLDSNGTISVTGGTLEITSADRGGDSPLDANGSITVADGVVIMANGAEWDPATATGPGGMGPGGGGMGGPGMPGRP